MHLVASSLLQRHKLYEIVCLHQQAAAGSTKELFHENSVYLSISK